MVKYCCVPFCRSRKTKDCKLLFHAFPASANLREKWLQALQQHTRKSPRNSNPFVVKDQTKVCSRHFLKTDYWYTGNVLKLRKSATPTVFTLPKGNDNISTSSTSTKENRQKPDFVSKEGKLTSKHQTKNVKQVTVKIHPRKAIELIKKKQKSLKTTKSLKDPEMIKNCRNLLLITKDHPYAALWQNESVKSKRGSSSEDDTDMDENKTPAQTEVTESTTDTNLEREKQLPVVEKSIVETPLVETPVVETPLVETPVVETPVVEKQKTSTNKNDTETRAIIKPRSNTNVVNKEATKIIESVYFKEKNDTETRTNIKPRSNTNVVNKEATKIIETVYFKEEVIEEISENVDETSICESNNTVLDTSTGNETAPCNQPIQNHDISTVAADTQTRNTETDKVSHTKPTKRANATSKKGLPEICILCATANMTRKNYTLIVHFSAMIKDLSGVDILKSNVSPTACNVCFKNVLEMWNFKQQIMAADKFIRERIPKQTPTLANTGNLPKPTAATFEYIDCNKHNSNSSIINNESYSQIESVDNLGQEVLKQKPNKALTIVKHKSTINQVLPKATAGLHKKDNGITLVPIENILKENPAAENDYDDIDSESSEDSSDLPTCTDCGKTFPDKDTRICKCKETVKKKATQPEKFVCSICGKQYPLLRSLKRHEVTHKTKKYLCSVCGEVFHFQLYLKRHMRKHSGKKPFPCPYCNKKFSTRWNLSQHKRLHTNSLPYECRLCPTAFRHNVTLKKHVRLFHTADEFMRFCHSSVSSAKPDAVKN